MLEISTNFFGEGRVMRLLFERNEQYLIMKSINPLNLRKLVTYHSLLNLLIREYDYI